MSKSSRNNPTINIDRILDLYLSGAFPPGADPKVQAWLVDEAHAAEKDEALRRRWERQVRERRPDAAAYRLLEEIRDRLGFERRPVRSFRSFSLRRMTVRVAAALIPCLVAGGAMLLTTGERIDPGAKITVRAEDRGHVHVVLPDGSEAWVHRGGEIAYPEAFADGRVVEMRGEVYFSVAEQDGEPFTVTVDGMEVRVLGTEFLVQAGDEASRSRVEVASGRVEVAVASQVHVLNRNERLVYDELLGVSTLDRVADRQVAPWRGVDLEFENCSLDEIFQRLGTFYGVNLQIEGNMPQEDRITVRFSESEPLDEVLFIIQKTSGSFDYVTEANTVTITRR